MMRWFSGSGGFLCILQIECRFAERARSIRTLWESLLRRIYGWNLGCDVKVCNRFFVAGIIWFFILNDEFKSTFFVTQSYYSVVCVLGLANHCFRISSIVKIEESKNRFFLILLRLLSFRFPLFAAALKNISPSTWDLPSHFLIEWKCVNCLWRYAWLSLRAKNL